MQVIYQNKDEKGVSGRIGILDFDIYIGRISRYIEGEYVGRFEVRRLRIHISSIKRGVWERR